MSLWAECSEGHATSHKSLADVCNTLNLVDWDGLPLAVELNQVSQGGWWSLGQVILI
jgi:hypothetical protein